ncbi:MAG: CBM35 domain-containing protein, partial [Bacteroidota bacterium]
VGQISLNAGSNTIVIKKQWGYINVDYIEVSNTTGGGGNDDGDNTGGGDDGGDNTDGGAGGGTPTTLFLEAEDATLIGMTTNSTISGYSGSGYADGMTDNGDEVRFSVNPAGSSYNVYIGYLSWGNTQQNYLVVNGSQQSNSYPPTNGTFSELSLGIIALNANQNNILSIKKEWGYIKVDYIRLEPVSGANLKISSNIKTLGGINFYSPKNSSSAVLQNVGTTNTTVYIRSIAGYLLKTLNIPVRVTKIVYLNPGAYIITTMDASGKKIEKMMIN